jgi:hypothetical protein
MIISILLYINLGITVTYQRIQATWEAQIIERQDRILKILTEKVGRQVGLHKQLFTGGITPVDNPYKDNLDDLSDDPNMDDPNMNEPQTSRYQSKVTSHFNY